MAKSKPLTKVQRSSVKIFLSYPSEKTNEVERIFGRLSKYGFDVWMDKRSLEPGNDWEKEIRSAIESRQVFIACLSNSTTTERYQHEELKIARDTLDRVPAGSVEIIPIRLEPCPPVDILAKFHWLEAFELLDDRGWEHLIGAIERNARAQVLQARKAVAYGPERVANLRPFDPKNVVLPDAPENDAALDQYAVLKFLFDKRDFKKLKSRLSESSPSLRIFAIWLRWVIWYEEARNANHTWPSLGRDINANLSGSMITPRDFLDGCRPVAEGLTTAWLEAFHGLLDQFRRDLVATPDAALRFIDALGPLLSDPWPRLVTSATYLTSETESLCLLVQNYHFEQSRLDGEMVPAPTFQDLVSQPFPPSREALGYYQHRAKLAAASNRLGDVLTGGQLGDHSEATTLLVADLKDRHPSDLAPTIVDRALVLRERWIFALSTLLTRDGDEKKALEELRRCGEVYTEAAAQAHWIAEWLDTKDAYFRFEQRCKKAWPESLEPMVAYGESLKCINDSLLRPIAKLKPTWIDHPKLMNLQREIVDKLEELRIAEKSWQWLSYFRKEVGPGESIRRTPRRPPIAKWERFHQAFHVLENELRTSPFLWEGSPETWPPEVLTIPGDRSAQWQEKTDLAVRELETSLRTGLIVHAFSIPCLERLADNLSRLSGLQELWKAFECSLESKRLEPARTSLVRIQDAFHPLPWLQKTVALLQEAQAACIGKESGTVFSWQDTRTKVKQIRQDLNSQSATAPSWAPKLVTLLIKQNMDALDALDIEIDEVSRSEERIRKSIEMLDVECYSDAAESLGQLATSLGPGLPQLLSTDVELWRAAANALADWATVSSDRSNTAGLFPNASTGLAPDASAIEDGRENLSRIRDCAQKAADLVARANKQSKLRCGVSQLEQALSAAKATLDDLEFLSLYAKCAAQVKTLIDQELWRDARVEMSSFDPGKYFDSYARLLSAINIGVEAANFPERRNRLNFLKRHDLNHPFLERLRRERDVMEAEETDQWSRLTEAATRLCDLPARKPNTLIELLRTPVVSDPAGLSGFAESLSRLKDAGSGRREEILRIAGRNRSALLALSGDVQGVVKEIRTSTDYVPHNLVVAAVSHLGRHKTMPPEMDAVLGASALLRWSPLYQKNLITSMQVSLPDVAAMTTELERLFVEAGQHWGSDTDQGSPALRFQIELWATIEVSNSPAVLSLPWPMGPALVDFYQLHPQLLLGLRKADPSVRRWYGPLAAAEALLRCGHPQEARNALPKKESFCNLSAIYPIYSSATDAARALSDDLAAFTANCGLFELRQAHVDSTGSLEQLSLRVSQTLMELLGLHPKPEDAFREIDRLFGELSDVDGFVRVQDAYNGMCKILEVVDTHAPFQGYARALRIKRGDLTLKLLLLKAQASVGGIDPILPELIKLAEQAVLDNPTDPTTNVLRQAIRTLKAYRSGPAALETQRRSVELLQVKALQKRWPYEIIETIGQLHHLIEGMGDYETWVRDLFQRSTRKAGKK